MLPSGVTGQGSGLPSQYQSRSTFEYQLGDGQSPGGPALPSSRGSKSSSWTDQSSAPSCSSSLAMFPPERRSLPVDSDHDHHVSPIDRYSTGIPASSAAAIPYRMPGEIPRSV